MPALLAGIHALANISDVKGVDGRDAPGHDERGVHRAVADDTSLNLDGRALCWRWVERWPGPRFAIRPLSPQRAGRVAHDEARLEEDAAHLRLR